MNELTFDVVADLTGETAEEEHEKAVERVRKGGKAHKEVLTPEQRKEIARKAAGARWEKKQALYVA